jgi:hypothetical protein
MSKMQIVMPKISYFASIRTSKNIGNESAWALATLLCRGLIKP